MLRHGLTCVQTQKRCDEQIKIYLQKAPKSFSGVRSDSQCERHTFCWKILPLRTSGEQDSQRRRQDGKVLVCSAQCRKRPESKRDLPFPLVLAPPLTLPRHTRDFRPKQAWSTIKRQDIHQHLASDRHPGFRLDATRKYSRYYATGK